VKSSSSAWVWAAASGRASSWWGNTPCHHSTPFVLNGPRHFLLCISQYICDVTLVPCWMNSTISTPFLSQKQMPRVFWQADNVCLNFFACLVNVCSSSTLNALWVQHSGTEIWLSSPRTSLPPIWYRCFKKKIQSPSNSLRFVSTREHIRSQFARTFW
jgi:hypothetical protein